MEELKNKIIEIIKDIQPYEEFTDFTNLLDEEILDSVSVFVLVQDLESEFRVDIGMDEINKENFTNIISIAELINAKIGK